MTTARKQDLSAADFYPGLEVVCVGPGRFGPQEAR